MNLKETEIEGTIQPDGTLVLDEPTRLPPGRVKVVLRQGTESTSPRPIGDEFFRMMEEIWAGQNARGHVPRTQQEFETERQAMRGQVEDEIEASIQLQEECRRRRRQAEGETPTP